jgi:predicted DNA-binding antitoxin AbrB/MazE fold protein
MTGSVKGIGATVTTVDAIYRDGMFQPIGRVNLPEDCHVKLQIEPVEVAADEGEAIVEIYRLMGKRFNSGERDVAERHNEHQP